ncbi:MAG: hypothetical protein AAFQ98_08675 [Bacteroidota bacterium]
MRFNSIEFAIFLPVVFVLFWFVAHRKIRYQNLLILAASYVFYGWWDVRFLSLIMLSTFVDYGIGLSLHKATSTQKRKILLGLSLIVNLGLLFIFKYFNFFVDSFHRAAR